MHTHSFLQVEVVHGISVLFVHFWGILHCYLKQKTIRTERHTHTFGCSCFDTIVYIKSHLTNSNHDCLK